MFPAVHFPLLCSALALSDSSNGTLHQSKRPVGVLSQSESLHFKKNILILRHYTTCLSQWNATSCLPCCLSAPPDARKWQYLSSRIILSFPFIISFFFFFFFSSEDFYAFIYFSGPYHHSNWRLWQGCHFDWGSQGPVTYPCGLWLQSSIILSRILSTSDLRNSLGDQIVAWWPGPTTELHVTKGLWSVW